MNEKLKEKGFKERFSHCNIFTLIGLPMNIACFSSDLAVNQGMRYERGEMRDEVKNIGSQKIIEKEFEIRMLFCLNKKNPDERKKS